MRTGRWGNRAVGFSAADIGEMTGNGSIHKTGLIEMAIDAIKDGESGLRVREKLNHLIEARNTFVSPLEFGAKFDAKTDDTDAIQASIDTGQHIIFPPGTALISRELKVIGLSGRLIEGAGRGATTIKQTSSNCPIFVVSGSRLSFKNLFLTWERIQTSDDRRSAAFDVLDKKPAGGILATSRFESISITQCAIGFDFSNAIGYSNTLVDFQVSSFAISAIYSDSQSGFTQCRFDSIYIQNQRGEYLRGLAVAGDRETLKLPGDTIFEDGPILGTSLVIEGGTAASGQVRWITGYSEDSHLTHFLPPSSVRLDSTSKFQIARIGVCSDAPFRLEGFTDAYIGMIAFEFLRLPKSCPSPILITSCSTVVFIQCRFERISFSAKNSALITASGRTSVQVQSFQTQYCAALREHGLETISLSATYFQAVVRFATLEFDNWLINVPQLWARLVARSAKDREEAPCGGTIFDQIVSGDGSLSPVGQFSTHLGPNSQTAIIGRPPAEQRGVSIDESHSRTYKHDLFRQPDEIRYGSPLEADVDFQLDGDNLIAGVTVTVARSSKCAGPHKIRIRNRSEELSALVEPGASVRLLCDGKSYRVIS